MNLLRGDSNSAETIGPVPSYISNCPRGKSSNAFLRKLFSRQPSMPKLVTEGSEDHKMHPQSTSDDNSNDIDFEVMLCPYIHPLGNRLEPRAEIPPLGPRPVVEASGMVKSHKEEIPCRAGRSCLPINKAYEEPYNNPTGSDFMRIRSSMAREDIAMAAAADANHLREWDYYIKCYTEGRYSLTFPPGPPPKNSKFTYLPSSYPPNEMERLDTFQSSHIWSGSEIAWSNSEVERARSLIIAATTKFATPWASISFFDRDTEIVQAERGYSRHLIPRHKSIASHVLLTNEVMTVLDTHKDWRFLGNPLVVGNPKIRFFAGAPLLSDNSQTIGVFAIFGPEPRASFTAAQRRYLVALSEIATRDLTSRRQVAPDVDFESSHPQQPGSYNSDVMKFCKPTSSPTLSHTMDSHRDSSTTIRYHKASKKGTPRSRLILNSKGKDALVHNGAYTPPSSDGSEAGPSPNLGELRSFGENDKQCSLTDWPSQLPNDIKTPNSSVSCDLSPNFDTLQRGAFSESDLDYIYQEPTPFRADFFYKHDTTESIARFKMHSASFCSDAADLLVPHLNNPNEQASGSSLSINSKRISSKGRGTLLEEAFLLSEIPDTKFANENKLMWAPASETEEASTCSIEFEATYYENDLDAQKEITSDMTLQEVHGSVDVRAEAKFAAELWAKNLEFDAIYAVELRHKKNSNEQFETIGPNNVETRILVAYGLPDPIKFDIRIHLDVLHGPGAITWENKKATPKEYSRGFMMPLIFKRGVLDYGSSGVVFGAFRRRPESLRSAEIERLQRAASVLKGILSKPGSIRLSSEEATGPPSSPVPQSCPVNGAIEVNRVFFDAGMATSARRKKPNNSVRWHLGGSE